MISWSIHLVLLLTVVNHNGCCNAFVIPAPTNRAAHIRAPRSPTRIVQLQQQPSLLRVNYKYKRFSNSNDNARHNHQYHLALQEPAMIQSLVSYLLSSSMGPVPLVQACAINALGFAILLKPLSKMLTPSGLLNAFFLGSALWATLGWKGWSVCVAYLFLGVLVTKIRFREKEKMGIAEKRGGKRGPENLWGSATTGLACAILSRQGRSVFGIPSQLYVLAYVASLATKLADTFASEIGKAYGKTTFLITNFKRVEPGTEGAVSAEGTAAAALGGFILSAYGWSLGLISFRGVAISTAAAFLATNAESFLGATVQEKKGLEWMTNEVINFLNTLIGGALAIAGGKLLL